MNISAKMRTPGGLYACLSGAIESNKPFIRQLMRLSVVVTLIILTTFQVLLATSTRGQNMHTDKVTIGLRDESLASGLKKIEQQTSLRFYYRKADIKMLTGLNLPLGTRTVEQTLQELLQNTFFTFRQIDGNILLETNDQQTTYEIRGRVVDINHKAVEFATVRMMKVSADQIIQSAQTDTGGYFRLAANEKGDYLIKISSMGMDSLSVGISLADLKVVVVPDIVLSNNVKQLKQVIVTSKRPYIEQKIDRTVVNVNALISNTGANALEVLEKSPGVIVDVNGNITFKGKSGVMVMIDDKPTYLSGDNLASYLKSLPAAQMDQIELMSNPPAKYDASGNAGVINIITKKSKAMGFNGNLSASFGEAAYFRTNENLNLNYRTRKVNLFASAGYNLLNGYRNAQDQRDDFDAAGNLTTAYKASDLFKSVNSNPNLKLGMDYYLSPKTIIGFVFTGSLSSGNNHNTGTSTFSDGTHVLDSTIQSYNYRKNKFNNGGINLNYSHQFDTLGKVLSFDFDYLKYTSGSDQSFNSNAFYSDGTLIDNQTTTGNLPTNIHIYSAKTDYAQPLKGKAKIEAGLKSSYVNTDNSANYFDVVNGISTVDYNNTNRFLYKENINAAYVSFSKEFNRFAIKAGLRAENTNADGHQLGNAQRPDSAFNNHYTDLFPTAYLNYKLDTAGSHLLNFAYGRRIDRPYYQSLNPFINIFDRFNERYGNPFLKPQLSSDYQLTYSYKGIFSMSFDYNYVGDYQIENVRQTNDVFISQDINIKNNINYGGDFNFNLDFTKWWNFNLYMEVFNNSYDCDLSYAPFKTGHTYYYIGNTNQFTLPDGWSAELGFYHQSKTVSGQWVHDPLNLVNAGIQKKVLHNKGAIKLAARDIFRGNISTGMITNIPNTVASYHFDNATRVVTLGFSYSFGNSGKNPKKRDTNSAESEQNRVKQ